MGMNKYDRLLHILNLLRTHKNLNAQRLAKECGVTERSIYRDIISLSEMNVPIYYDRGYKLASDNFLPPLNFTFEEYHLLKIALEASPLVKTNLYNETYKSVMAKIENCLSERVMKEKKFTPETTYVTIAVDDEQEKGERFYSQIEKAITTMTTLYLKYNSVKSGITERKVDPYFIIFRGHAFYFVGYCHLRDEFRTFRINRVMEIIPTDEVFIKKENISPHTYFEGSWSVYSGSPVTVEVKFKGAAAKVILSSRHHQDEKIEIIDDNTLKYSVVTRGIEEIQRWIVGFGAQAEVLVPQELKDNLNNLGKYLCEQYNQD